MKVRGALLSVACDTPAARKIVGFGKLRILELGFLVNKISLDLIATSGCHDQLKRYFGVFN